MKVIKELANHIREELEDAENYAWLAIHNKADHPALADLYSRLSMAEIDHSNMLHKEAVDIIEKHKRDGHEAPAAMKAVWDWEHEKFMEDLAEVRRLLELYKNS